MYCEHCGSPIADDSVFCPSCGASLAPQSAQAPSPEPAKFCPNCGAPLQDEDMFCVSCGAKVSGGQSGGQGYSAKGAYDMDQTMLAEDEYAPAYSGGETVSAYGEPARAKKRPPIWLFLVVGLVVLALIGGGVGWMIGHHRQGDGDETGKVEQEDSDKGESTDSEEDSDDEDDPEEDTDSSEDAEDDPDFYDDDSEDEDDEDTDSGTSDIADDSYESAEWSLSNQIMPETATRVLSDAEVEELARDNKKLNYVKNEIYARHHYKFEKSEMISYFGGGGYNSNDQAEAEFNEYERQNKEKLAAKENSPGYPKYQPVQ